jgi:hypothetical protein
VTTGYAGWLRRFGPQLFDVAQQPWARSAHGRHSGALERVRLSPEVANGDEMRRVTASLRDGGCEVFSLTFHRPSMVAGHTPYVRSAADLELFIATVYDYCVWFRNEIGGQFKSLGN